MPMILNIPFRPDLNGIERLWRSAKARYRAKVDNFKACHLKWDQMTLVKEIM